MVQECGAGLVTVWPAGDALSFAAPPLIREGPLDEPYLNRIVAAFGIGPGRVLAHQWVDNGPGWAVVQLATAAEVLALEPDLSLLPDGMFGAIGGPSGLPVIVTIFLTPSCSASLTAASMISTCRRQRRTAAHGRRFTR
ncbi:PhzF family phenazine biosynthesis protein [Streptomyces sp. Ag109_O5-1]|uniref:PhzF family phenazine biosynthesis protein n=1 Tax=Streptomyces sp. Ag109_O5-1 TaxID=1938851 RepID=UPI001628F64D|nr:PhzF family phenazine biosynthesis protein [Streptomyces sp. Ag109_O5-1]